MVEGLRLVVVEKEDGIDDLYQQFVCLCPIKQHLTHKRERGTDKH